MFYESAGRINPLIWRGALTAWAYPGAGPQFRVVNLGLGRSRSPLMSAIRFSSKFTPQHNRQADLHIGHPEAVQEGSAQGGQNLVL